MARETIFVLPFDIPTTPKKKYYFRAYMKQLSEQLERPMGDEGQNVGIGFLWTTQTGLSDKGGMLKLSRRMQRALRVSGIISHRAVPFHLEQRIKYIREGEPKAVFKLVEEDS